ncbi:MAG: hypothetical protein COA49_09805 [Bacteroidetes bacterium]|nr:MAG: hypothetical protein COA49_09805 [Bacteroidota bacterium]
MKEMNFLIKMKIIKSQIMKTNINKSILSVLMIFSLATVTLYSQEYSKIYASYQTYGNEKISFAEFDIFNPEDSENANSDYYDLYEVFGFESFYFQTGQVLPGTGTFNNITRNTVGTIYLWNTFMTVEVIPSSSGTFNYLWDINNNQVDTIIFKSNYTSFLWDNHITQDLESGNFYGIKQNCFDYIPKGVLYVLDSNLNDLDELDSIGIVKPIGPDSYNSITGDLYLLREFEIDDVDHYTIQFYNVNSLEVVDSIEVGAVKLAPNSLVNSMTTGDFWGVRWELGETSINEYWIHIGQNGEVTDLAPLPPMPENWTLVEATVLDQTNLIATLLYQKANSMFGSKLVSINAVTGEIISTIDHPYWLYGIRADNTQFAIDNFNLVVSGCTNENGCNYDPLATEEDMSCVLIGDSCDDGDVTTFDDIIQEDCSCSGIVNIQEIEQKIEFDIIPNPSEGEFQLNIQEGTSLPLKVSLYNINGQLVFEKIITTRSTNLNLTQLNPGTYYLAALGVKTSKVIIVNQ